MNYVLYRCNEEERVDGCGGVYHIPHHGNLTYAGIVGKFFVASVSMATLLRPVFLVSFLELVLLWINLASS